MALTPYSPTPTKQAGNIKILFGPKITSLAAPSLATFTVDATCAISQFGTSTDVTMEERQDLCSSEAYEWLEKRTRKLDQLVFRAKASDEATLLALLAEDAEVGIFVRPQVASATAAATADKGWTFNAKVAKIDPNPIAVGNDFEWMVEFYGVTRSLAAVMVA